MKKNYIYILISLFCFLCFSVDVKAEYEPICKYRYAGTYSSTSNDRVIKDAELSFDGSSNYKLDITTTAEKIKYNGEENNLDVFNNEINYFGSIKAQGNFSKGFNVFYSSDDLSSNLCPSNFIQNELSNVFCFYSGNEGKKWCEDKFKKHGSKIAYTYTGGNIESITYNKLNDGMKCENSLPVKTSLGDKFVYISFVKDGQHLKIQYKDGISDKLKDFGYNDSFVNFEYSKGDGNDRGYASAKIFLTNYDAGLHTDTVIIRTRSDFDRAYLEEWNRTGSCPVLKVDPNGKNDKFWVLLPPAAADAEEYGSSKIDVNNLQELKDWDFDWKNWYQHDDDYRDCEGLLGDTKDLIKDILFYVRILIPILLIVLGIADFIRAIFSMDEQAMKKAQNKFLKRLLVVAIIFLVPSLVNLLLNFVDGIWAHMENSACDIWG